MTVCPANWLVLAYEVSALSRDTMPYADRILNSWVAGFTAPGPLRISPSVQVDSLPPRLMQLVGDAPAFELAARIGLLPVLGEDRCRARASSCARMTRCRGLAVSNDLAIFAEMPSQIFALPHGCYGGADGQSLQLDTPASFAGAVDIG